MNPNTSTDLSLYLYQFDQKVNKRLKTPYEKQYELVLPIVQIEDDFIFVNVIKSNKNLINQFTLNLNENETYYIDFDNFFRIKQENFAAITQKTNYVLDPIVELGILEKTSELINDEQAKFRLYFINVNDK
ncbi:hypothetical protein GE118_03615 [Mycoplasma sp. NEAQ87857]|uniref:hypothetical protein n=1 Tax=Mycoplasma sp. NEAQ87857 TaxID=2683967 RepID=UPI0013196C18|nr:hypothetical protein [Mycoplasma sp. NEAQ87857]QGZ97237.1 hypothetical protein GE118_00265 [Mycoplasma sp. NEAQ87857]QGZ97870.1 hypothetical protein GE118_03615 [Mycoplasma sp. NEAQ87857]